MVLSIFFLGGLFVFGLPFLVVAGLTFGVSHTLGSLLMFFGLEKLFTGTNLVTLVIWLFRFFYS
jgi:hypothetical protein